MVGGRVAGAVIRPVSEIVRRCSVITESGRKVGGVYEIGKFVGELTKCKMIGEMCKVKCVS